MSGRREDSRAVMPFINAIRARPCLWNSSIHAYSKKELSAKAWKEIALELNDSEHNCRERWKNIRTAFVRSMKPAKPGRSAKKIYYLYDQLSFLLPFVKSKGQGKPETISGDESNGNIDEDGDEMSAEETVEEPSCDVQVYETVPKIERVETMEEEQREAEPVFKDWMATSTSTSTSKEDVARKEHDADEYFLLSLLPDIRKLSAQRKRGFKVETMSLLNKLLDEDEREASGSRFSAGFSK